MNCAVQGLHASVRQKRHFILTVESVALRQALRYVADGFCYDAVFLAGGAQIVPDVAGVEFRVRAFVPGYGERIESFFGSPHVIADDRYQVVEHNDLPYAGDLLRGGVVDLRYFAAQYRTPRQRGKIHPRHHRIRAVDSLTVGLVGSVEALEGIADQCEILWILERWILWDGLSARGIDEFAVTDCVSTGRVADDSVGCRATRRVHLPLFCRGLD